MVRLLVSSLAGVAIAIWIVVDGIWFGPSWQVIVGALLLVALARDVCLGVDERCREQRRLSEGLPAHPGRAPGDERPTRLAGPGRLLFVLAAFALVLAVASGVGRIVDRRIDCDSFSFDADDAALWDRPAAQRARYGDSSARQRLADGLVKCGTLDHADRASVRVRLGAPEYPAGGRSWHYTTGPNRRSGGWFQTDPERLIVSFDAAGRVTGLEIYPS